MWVGGNCVMVNCLDCCYVVGLIGWLSFLFLKNEK